MFNVLKFTFHLRIIGANSWHNRQCLEALQNSTMGHFRGVLWKDLFRRCLNNKFDTVLEVFVEFRNLKAHL